MQGREGCVVEIDAEQITLPAVDDKQAQTKVWAFILEHTHIKEGGRGCSLCLNVGPVK